MAKLSDTYVTVVNAVQLQLSREITAEVNIYFKISMVAAIGPICVVCQLKTVILAKMRNITLDMM